VGVIASDTGKVLGPSRFFFNRGSDEDIRDSFLVRRIAYRQLSIGFTIYGMVKKERISNG
jgi:hypothetical protein